MDLQSLLDQRQISKYHLSQISGVPKTTIMDICAGLPKDQGYLECGLPPFLADSVSAMKAAWDKLDRGETYLRWDCDYCNLQTDINNAEVNQIISPEQAWYLREKYLRMERA